MKINLFNLIVALLLSSIVGFYTSFGFVFLVWFLLFVPGYLFSDLFLFKDNFKIWEKLIISPAVSIAFISIITYLFSLIGLNFSLFLICLSVFSLFVLFLFKNRDYLAKLRDVKFVFEDSLALLFFAAVFAAYLTIIFLPTANMNVPLFADTSLHATIVRLFQDARQIPETWGGYAPIKFNHQPGFGSLVLWFTYFSEITIPRLILFVTNIIHALIPVSLLFLSRVFIREWKYNFLVFLLGVASLFPLALFRSGSNATVLIYFLTPIFTGVLIRMFKKYNFNTLSILIFLTLSFSGGLLVHPLFGVFMAFLFIPFILINKNWNIKNKKEFWKVLILSTAMSLLVVTPFFFSESSNHDLLENQWDRQSEYINPQEKISPLIVVEPNFFLFNNPPPGRIDEAWSFYIEDFSLREFLNYPIGIFFTLIMVLSVWLIYKKRFVPGIYGLFIFLLFLLFSWVQSYLRIPFPGWSALYSSRFKFFMILPVAFILGSIVLLQEKKKSYLKNTIKACLILSLVVSSLMNGVFLNNISRFETVSDEEVEAFEWITAEIEQDALIANAITEVDSGVFIGGAGQWIPSLVGNPVLFPSLSLTEEVSKIEDRLVVMKRFEDKKASDPKTIELLKKYEVDYIFISTGEMHSPIRDFERVDVNQFQSSYYTLEFKNESNYIYSINYENKQEN